MRIGIDAHAIGTTLAGNATVAASVIDALAEADQRNEYTLYFTHSETSELYRGKWPNFSLRMIRPHMHLMRIPFAMNVELRRRPVDVLFVQYTAPPFAPCKVVTAIHDISYEHLPETFNRSSVFQMKLTIRHTARHAARIITPSDYSRQDIIDTYKLAPEKVTTILQAAPAHIRKVNDADELERIRKKYDLPSEFILGVGSVQPRKNLRRLIEAYSRLSHTTSDIPSLILVGKHAWLSGSSVDAAAEFGVADKVRFTGFVPDEDLAGLYSASTLFVYPSYFEGFGLPPLEAMQCGVPVIAGNKTSVPEVVGDAGILVDPFDVDSIAEAIGRGLSDTDLRTSLIELGFQRAKLFTWQKAARELLEVFVQVHAG